jgi:glutaconyl-CoA/methylmalonyl-CoA decarboxylase subunit delta
MELMKIEWNNILLDGLVIIGFGITGLLLVFGVIYLVFIRPSGGLKNFLRKRLEKHGLRFEPGEQADIPADVAAAITMALYLSTELHDEESNVLTIERKPRIYNPWNDKIHAMRTR